MAAAMLIVILLRVFFTRLPIPVPCNGVRAQKSTAQM